MKRILSYVLLAVAVVLAVSVARPYWDRYWIGKDIEAAAVYGTKNSIQDTMVFLNKKLDQAGYHFPQEDFKIEKDGKNRVTIRLKYKDAVSVFGKKLKHLTFTITKTVSEVKELL